MVQRILDAIALPAFLVHGRAVTYANEAARRAYRRTPRWVFDGTRARRGSVELEGRAYELVVECPEALPLAISSLPPALRAVAKLLAEGKTDKEIARSLGRSHSTVRTYVTRVLDRLGVRSRRGLVATRKRPRSARRPT